MDLLHLLNHDICDHIINFIDLTSIIRLPMCSKSMPNLLNHRYAKEIFLREMQEPMPDILKNNKKIISFIYNHKLAQNKYWSENDDNIVQKIIMSIGNNDNSHIYYYMYIQWWFH